jgi:hypothetical protein
MRKSLLVMLGVALLIGLVPVAATAKRPTPPEPTPLASCDIKDGTLNGYEAGTSGYVCTLISEGESTWSITVTPATEIRHMAFGIKDDEPGAFCGEPVAVQAPTSDPVTGLFTLPADGDCSEEWDTPNDNDKVFVLWIGTDIRKQNMVENAVVVTVLQLQPQP